MIRQTRALMLSSYSRKTGNRYLLWFVARTGVLQNTIVERVDAYPLSAGYLDKAYNMVNHMLVVSPCFVPWTTKAAQNSLRKISWQIQHEPVAFQAVLDFVSCPGVEHFTSTNQARPLFRFCCQHFAHPRREAKQNSLKCFHPTL